MYNATTQSHAEGTAKNDTLLIGKMVGTWEAGSTWGAMVPRHGLMAYRLRPKGSHTAMRRKRVEF